MQDNELKYYEKIGNWDFSDIRCKTERVTNWDFYKKIREYSNEVSLCLDLGTGGGEKVLTRYPNVGMIIGTDFSKVMIETANINRKKYPDKKVKFVYMDSLNMNFPQEMFDLISVRHTVMDAKQLYNVLAPKGVVIIEGIDKKDCWDLKELAQRGQAFNDKISIAEKDYFDLQSVGFSKIEKIEIIENEYYETKDDLMALLLKVPILDDWSELNKNNFEHVKVIEKEVFDEYVERNTTEKGILLKRVLYGIVAKK